MREILFRGRENDGTWRFGNYISGDSHNYIYVKERLNPFCSIQNETVGQYTGLKDNNGEKVFEGDIIKSKYCFGTVKYMDGCFYIINDKEKVPIDIAIELEDLEVIGNIHDSTELIPSCQS